MEAAPEVLVQASVLKRHFRTGGVVVPALDGVDFLVRRGEFIALVGPSGSGKSTLLNLIGALDRPSQGEIRVGEVSLGEAPDAEFVRYRRERVGFIFQSFNLLPTLTARENVEVPMKLAGVPRPDRSRRALGLLGSVGLSPRSDHRPHELSGGEKQRVAVARALANHPSLLLADEPTGNLDSHAGAKILDLLCELVRSNQLTLIMVTHDLQIAKRADRIIHMQDGQIRLVESPTTLPEVTVSEIPRI